MSNLDPVSYTHLELYKRQRLGIQQQSVLGLARRNSIKLTLYEAVMFYQEHGFKKEEIFIESLKSNLID